MKLKRSEIFENYAKIALEKGLIDNKIIATAEAMTQEDKYKNSEYKKNIEQLYHINLDSKDILDEAHPKSVIVGPAYDKTNALVENLKERHDVMVGIVNKMPGSDNIGHKYASAHNDLLSELIKIGYSMDNKRIDDLRILADSCSERITKKAFLPLIAGGVAAVVALIAIINHTTPSDQGVFNNCEKAIVEITELKPKLPQIGKNIDKLLEDLKFLQSLSKQYNDLDGIDASTPEKLISAANTEKSKFDLVKKYKSACAYMKDEITNYITMINSYKMQTDRSWDWWQKLKNVSEYLTGDDKEDAVLALKTLQKSLDDSVVEANQFMELAKQQEPGLIAALSKFNPDVPSETPISAAKPENHVAQNHPANHQTHEDEDLNPEDLFHDGERIQISGPT
jgi:hypothetical protein